MHVSLMAAKPTTGLCTGTFARATFRSELDFFTIYTSSIFDSVIWVTNTASTILANVSARAAASAIGGYRDADAADRDE